MRKVFVFLSTVLITCQMVDCGCSCQAWCQKNGQPYGICGDGDTCLCSSKLDEKSKEYIRGQYKLTIVDHDTNGFDEQTQQRIIDTFFQVYPRIFNHVSTVK